MLLIVMSYIFGDTKLTFVSYNLSIWTCCSMSFVFVTYMYIKVALKQNNLFALHTLVSFSLIVRLMYVK